MTTVAVESGVGVSKTTLDHTIDILTQLLSDEQVLCTKLLNCHWNVVGPHFRELHTLFDEQHEVLVIRIDEVAERVRALGARAAGTMTEYLQQTVLREHPGSSPTANEMLRELLGDHEAVIRSLRESLTPARNNLDVGTTDFLTGLIREHEKMAWALRATLSGSLDDHQTRYSVLYE